MLEVERVKELGANPEDHQTIVFLLNISTDCNTFGRKPGVSSMRLTW